MLEFELNRMNIVATDGHTLLLVPVALDYVPEALVTKQFILDRAGVDILCKAIPTKVSVKNPLLHVSTPAPDDNFLTFSSQASMDQHVPLIDGKFPDYRRVIPSLNTREAPAHAIGVNLTYITRLDKLKPLLTDVNGLKLHPRGANESMVFIGPIAGTNQELTAVVMPMRL